MPTGKLSERDERPEPENTSIQMLESGPESSTSTTHPCKTILLGVGFFVWGVSSVLPVYFYGCEAADIFDKKVFNGTGASPFVRAMVGANAIIVVAPLAAYGAYGCFDAIKKQSWSLILHVLTLGAFSRTQRFGVGKHNSDASLPWTVLEGVSVAAINACVLASGAVPLQTALQETRGVYKVLALGTGVTGAVIANAFFVNQFIHPLLDYLRAWKYDISSERRDYLQFLSVLKGFTEVCAKRDPGKFNRGIFAEFGKLDEQQSDRFVQLHKMMDTFFLQELNQGDFQSTFRDLMASRFLLSTSQMLLTSFMVPMALWYAVIPAVTAANMDIPFVRNNPFLRAVLFAGSFIANGIIFSSGAASIAKGMGRNPFEIGAGSGGMNGCQRICVALSILFGAAFVLANLTQFYDNMPEWLSDHQWPAVVSQIPGAISFVTKSLYDCCLVLIPGILAKWMVERSRSQDEDYSSRLDESMQQKLELVNTDDLVGKINNEIERVLKLSGDEAKNENLKLPDELKSEKPTSLCDSVFCCCAALFSRMRNCFGGGEREPLLVPIKTKQAAP